MSDKSLVTYNNNRPCGVMTIIISASARSVWRIRRWKLLPFIKAILGRGKKDVNKNVAICRNPNEIQAEARRDLHEIRTKSKRNPGGTHMKSRRNERGILSGRSCKIIVVTIDRYVYNNR